MKTQVIDIGNRLAQSTTANIFKCKRCGGSVFIQTTGEDKNSTSGYGPKFDCYECNKPRKMCCEEEILTSEEQKAIYDSFLK